MKALETKPEISQHDLALKLGVSFGRENYCLKALIEVGLLKATNLSNNKNKLAYMYLLTPIGVKEKSVITERFLKAKLAEYESLEAEIEMLRSEEKGIPDAEVSHS
ncbi:MAG: EPS-associated MarR family transcriptional regulator [Methylophilaceae bacterium]